MKIVYFFALLVIPAVFSGMMGIKEPEMVRLSGGSFYMGNNNDLPDQKPQHQVTVSGFYMGKKEVTVGEWKEYCKASGMAMPENPAWPLLDNYPMVYIGWVDALEYCNWLSKQHNLNLCYTITKVGNNYTISCNFSANGYRLPTEAEWEFAARGGIASRNYIYAGSNSLDEVGFYGYNSDNKPHPVGQKKPNELGLYDMSGNAWEWCWDLYDAKYYSVSPKVNPHGPEKGQYRVLRGGSLLRNEAACRVANRYYAQWQNFRGNSNGFRLCRNEK